jgi:hypothetical protein
MGGIAHLLETLKHQETGLFQQRAQRVGYALRRELFAYGIKRCRKKGDRHRESAEMSPNPPQLHPKIISVRETALSETNDLSPLGLGGKQLKFISCWWLLGCGGIADRP